MTDYIIMFMLIIGTAFIVLATVGLIRFPDIYMRISAITKSSTLGVSGILVAVILHFWQLDITGRTLATILFLFSTAPIASQMIARASYFIGVSMWIKSKTDEMREKYNMDTHELKGYKKGQLPFEDTEVIESEEKKSEVNKKKE
jgi:multicomponent Na+:H+ antiporter subunit G